MPSAEGTILAVQEGRFRLLTDDGRGLLFVLATDAPLEPQDLPSLTHRRVRVAYRESQRLIAGIAHDLHILDGKGAPP